MIFILLLFIQLSTQLQDHVFLHDINQEVVYSFTLSTYIKSRIETELQTNTKQLGISLILFRDGMEEMQ